MIRDSGFSITWAALRLCKVVMDRITAIAVQPHDFRQPQPQLRLFFFNKRAYLKKYLYKKKFILPILKLEL